jgi:hypothetical protein
MALSMLHLISREPVRPAAAREPDPIRSAPPPGLAPRRAHAHARRPGGAACLALLGLVVAGGTWAGAPPGEGKALPAETKEVELR